MVSHVGPCLGRLRSNVGTLLVKCWDVFGQMLGRFWLNVGSLLVKCWDVVRQIVGHILARCGDHFAVLGVLTVDPGGADRRTKPARATSDQPVRRSIPASNKGQISKGACILSQLAIIPALFQNAISAYRLKLPGRVPELNMVELA